MVGSGCRIIPLGMLLLLVVLTGPAVGAGPMTRYVDAALASGDNDGRSWEHAFQGALGLQAALAVAQSGDEIWCAAGTYVPTDGADRAAAFVLIDGVSIYGGFAGAETERDERAPASNPTVLSGDIGAPDDASDNSYHVVRGVDVGATTVVCGFTITGGFADGDGKTDDDDGAAMLLRRSAAVIGRCRFLDNVAAGAGGAVRVVESKPGPELTACFFGANDAGMGGALSIDGAVVVVVNCIFSGNGADRGAAVDVAELGDVTLVNCTVAHNEARFAGGGVHAAATSTTTIRNSILWGNRSLDVGLDRQLRVVDGGAVQIDNCCLESWDDTRVAARTHGSNALFLDADGADDAFGTGDDDYRVDARSLCIDFGDSGFVPPDVETDIDGAPRIVGCVDLGAIEHDGVSTEMLDVGCDATSGVACFQGLGALPADPPISRATAMSADGLTVVGESRSTQGFEAIIWRVGGMAGLDDLPGGSFTSVANSVSGDGGVLVGRATVQAANAAFRWTPCGGMIDLGDLEGGSNSAIANAVSDNGQIVIGEAFGVSGQHAVRWVGKGPIEDLGELPGGHDASRGFGVSRDGGLVVGESASANGTEAAMWLGDDAPEALGDLPGAGFRSAAQAASEDGGVIVGWGSNADGIEAVRWTPTGDIEGLGDFPGGGHTSEARALSASGRIVVGYGNTGDGRRAFVWSPQTGLLNLTTVLADEYGLEDAIAGWVLEDATGISADGRTITGQGRNPANGTESWIVHLPYPLPCPGDVDRDGDIDFADLVQILSVWGQEGGREDVDGSGTVGFGDLVFVLSVWGPCE